MCLNSEQENTLTTPPYDQVPSPADITQILYNLAAEADDSIKQAEVLNHIIATTLQDAASIDAFNNKPVHTLKLSQLEEYYQMESRDAMKLLSRRNKIKIDEHYCLKVGTGNIIMKTDRTMIDYHLTVAKGIGLSSILPNATNSYRFCFEMDLKKPTRGFKGKHAMVGFDTKGKMLYIGTAMNEDIFLAMAPNDFLSCQTDTTSPGYSTGPPFLSQRHYRQVVMMFAHFLEKIPERSYSNINKTYTQDLDAARPNWVQTTNVL